MHFICFRIHNIMLCRKNTLYDFVSPHIQFFLRPPNNPTAKLFLVWIQFVSRYDEWAAERRNRNRPFRYYSFQRIFFDSCSFFLWPNFTHWDIIRWIFSSCLHAGTWFRSNCHFHWNVGVQFTLQLNQSIFNWWAERCCDTLFMVE